MVKMFPKILDHSDRRRRQMFVLQVTWLDFIQCRNCLFCWWCNNVFCTFVETRLCFRYEQPARRVRTKS